MSFQIYAWLDDGQPRLEIIEAQSNTVYLSWRYKEESGENNTPRDKKEIQRLFKDLILLTCKQEIKNCRLFQTKPDHSSDKSGLIC